MSEEERDRVLRDALDGAVLTVDPDPERRLGQIRRRGRMRRGAPWTAIITVLAVFVAAIGWAAYRLVPGDKAIPGGGALVTYRDPAIGWTVGHPKGWFVTSFENVCRPAFTGTMVASVDRAYHAPVSPSGCSWPPGIGGLPQTAVAVEFDARRGGPIPPAWYAAEPGLATFPLTLDQAASQFTKDGFSGYEFIVRLAEDDHTYMVSVWLGSAASKADRELARRVLGTIEPWRPAVSAAPGASASPSAMPMVVASPDHGPVGTNVHLEGTGFADSFRAGGQHEITLSRDLRPDGCMDALGETGSAAHVVEDGHLVADFVIPSSYGCAQESGPPGAVSPGTWDILIDCHVCDVGTFEVTKD